MQRKLAVFSFFIFILVLFSSNVSAQSASPAATRFKDQKKATVSLIKEEAKTMIAAKREEFKTKLQTIRDQKKKALVERIDAKLSTINTKHTDRFAQVLSTLQTLLNKISQSTIEGKVLADIKTAQAAIDTAKSTVENQAAKMYTIQITDETSLRLNVGTTTSQLRQDLMATHKLVVDAKQAVQALRKDAQMKKDATSSANL